MLDSCFLIPNQMTKAKTAVGQIHCFRVTIHAQYLALIIIILKLQYCVRDSSDILYQYS